LTPAILAFLLSAATSAGGYPGSGVLDGYAEETAPTGAVYSRGWSAEDRRAVQVELPRVLARIEERLGRRLGRQFTTVLAPDGNELRRVAEDLGAKPPPARLNVVGLALPARSVLILDGAAFLGLEPFLPVLAHEVAHLVIHRQAGASIPRWLDEGVAGWVSGEQVPPGDLAYLAFLARVGGLYPVARLEYAFPEGHESTSLAYLESRLVVEYLAAAHQAAAVNRLLDLCEEGFPAGTAVERVTGLSPEEFERDFRRWVAARASFLRALGSAVNPWTVAALLAVVAVVRHLVVRRRRLRKLAEEESAEEEAAGGGPAGDP
jgi:hypothetical protein